MAQPGARDDGGDERRTLSDLPEDLRALVLEDALDSLTDGFLVLDRDRSIVYWNSRMTDLTGYDDGLASMAPEELFVEGDREAVRDALAAAEGTGRVEIEATVSARNGSEVPVEFRGAVLTGEGGETLGYTGILRDVTERLEYERELGRQNERLEELVGAVSHDLRNPLNVITGRLELARERGDEEDFDAIRRAAERIDGLIDDLRELGRKGQTVRESESVDVAELARRAWNATPTVNADLTVRTDMVVDADPDRLRRAFENLFRNAVEHAGESVTVTVGDRTDEGGRGVSRPVIYVADDGPGIPPEEREEVFEYGVTTATDGTGVGLAIVRRIVEAHGWEVRAAEGDGGGARFEIVLPAGDVPA